MKTTIIGAKGFLGSAIQTFLIKNGHVVQPIYRGDLPEKDIHYGNIIYCAGIKSNFTLKIAELTHAHIIDLLHWLTYAQYNKFIYISSSRIYSRLDHSSESIENFNVHVNDIYNQSKIMAESICNALSKNCLIIRPSNIVGYEPNSSSFLWNIYRQLKMKNTLSLDEQASCKRDYVDMDFFCKSLISLINKNSSGIFNISSGVSLTNLDISIILNEVKAINKIQFGQNQLQMPFIENGKLVNFTGLFAPHPAEIISSTFKEYLTTI